MLTFLELYQTLLGFVLFKLYADVGLVYPPPLDAKKDEGGAGVGAYSLQEVSGPATSTVTRTKEVEVDGRRISGKDVRQTIKTITAAGTQDQEADMVMDENVESIEVDEDFIAHPSVSNPTEAASLPTLQTLAALPQVISTNLFAPYSFFLSRETSRPIFEFLIRSFGGRIGWPASSGMGSPYDELDESITHVIIDRPLVEKPDETPAERDIRRRRKYVQPQWVADCINAGKILLEDHYAQGSTLPPHLSPFGEREGAYDPTVGLKVDDATMIDDDEGESEADEVKGDAGDEEDDEFGDEAAPEEVALRQVAAASDDLAALRSAELAAEAAGVEYGAFEKEITKARRKATKLGKSDGDEGEKDMNKMLMSNKQRKLYERMKYGEKKRATEREGLEKKRGSLEKKKHRQKT